MINPVFSSLLKAITVRSKDDGVYFQDYDRIDAIKAILEDSDYDLIHEGSLFLLYGKKPVEGEEVIVISSHIDSVYHDCFCEEQEDYYKGTFDNSLTNAVVVQEMLAGNLPDNVVVAFTGDEEEESRGCYELIDYLENRCDTRIRFALVTDVTNEGWEDEAPLSVENDLGIDLYTAHALVEWLEPYTYTYIHSAEPDESWDFDEEDIPSVTLCIPVSGDMHSAAGVRVRKSSVPVYAEVLSMIASNLARE